MLRCLLLAALAFLIGAFSWTYVEEWKWVSPCIFGVTEVIDGDTVECHGHVMRMDGYNAPEIRGSSCERPAHQATEKAHGQKAKTILTMLIENENWPNKPTVSSLRCGFGRWCFDYQVANGKGGRLDVGEAMARCGLVDVVEDWDRYAPSWCKKNVPLDAAWCDEFLKARFPEQSDAWRRDMVLTESRSLAGQAP